MRTNWTTVVWGEQVVLVPYRRKYVARYHEWMQDPWIREMTASEPLSLEEEYQMQETWRDDAKKCTFIVLDKCHEAASTFSTAAMAGDVNLFLNDPDGDLTVAEIEIMVAEPRCRRRGLGREAVTLMMAYGVKELGLRRFFCKINEDNAPSIAMFESLGYRRCAYVAAFREIEFEYLHNPSPPPSETIPSSSSSPSPSSPSTEVATCKHPQLPSSLEVGVYKPDEDDTEENDT